jgi:hypothetical protein
LEVEPVDDESPKQVQHYQFVAIRSQIEDKLLRVRRTPAADAERNLIPSTAVCPSCHPMAISALIKTNFRVATKKSLQDFQARVHC